MTDLFELRINDKALGDEIGRYVDNEANSKENLLKFISDFMKETDATKIVFDD